MARELEGAVQDTGGLSPPKGQEPCPLCCLLCINPDMPTVYICPVVWLPETFDKCCGWTWRGEEGKEERGE